jgi:hypothetical protein
MQRRNSSPEQQSSQLEGDALGTIAAFTVFRTINGVVAKSWGFGGVFYGVKTCPSTSTSLIRAEASAGTPIRVMRT